MAPKPHFTNKRAQEIAQSLIDGVDPRSKQPVSNDSVLNQPDVMRALLTANMALETVMVRDARRAQLPGNVGHPWTKDEEEQLVAGFKEAMAASDFATLRGRTIRAIEARLERLGLLKAAGQRLLAAGSVRLARKREARPMLNSFVMHAVGNLARNPEPLTKENISYVRFCLSGNNHGFDEDGVERSSSSSFWLQAFGDNADRLIKHARKGVDNPRGVLWAYRRQRRRTLIAEADVDGARIRVWSKEGRRQSERRRSC